MDTSSIITQVKNPKDGESEVSNGGPVAALNERELRPAVKKPRSRGILSSIFCCFGAHGGPHGGPTRAFTEANHQSTTLVPPNHNQNTLTKGFEPDSEETISVNESEPSIHECYLLPKIQNQDMGKKCVVIDLDETLVHSSFKPVQNPDFIVPVEIDGTIHQPNVINMPKAHRTLHVRWHTKNDLILFFEKVYVLKRPYVDEFLRRMGELFECVLFTASLAKYADPVADLLDKFGSFRARLFRESCVFHNGNYVKDLSKLGRELHNIVIIDNSPASYIFHPENAVPVQSWFDDKDDTELMDLIPFFESLNTVDNAVVALQNNRNRMKTGRLAGTVITESNGRP